MKVKICGMRDAENVRSVASLKPDYFGFIFYAPSSRCCFGLDQEVIASISESIEPVMVTVDMDEVDIMRLADKYGFRIVQLHGGESSDMCWSLRNRGLKVIKALGLQSQDDLKTLERYEGAVDLFLFDTACATKGGSGKKFDWKILSSYNMDIDFMLSGGIGPEDADSLNNFTHPKFVGIDLNSRFESAPGLKDPY
ncbi:MAG: phosphoribosylanthranilate isomerase, partial [Muribaculaceae bacterium]|nr:phosphoribosylanthranilate isomerase [Muribaculaceae bacterium]